MSNITLSSQSTKHSRTACTFVPRSYHVLVVKRDFPERITETTTQSFRAHYMNIMSGEIEHSKTFMLKSPVHLYFTQARHFPGYAYICHWTGERFACSCKEGKQGYCNHIEELTNLHQPEILEIGA